LHLRKIILIVIISYLVSCKTKVDKTLDSLPLSESIIYSIDSFTETSDTSFKMRGWAFIDNKYTNEDIEYYLAIQNNNKYDLFKFDKETRSDVTNHFRASKNLNLDHSGFKIHFEHNEYSFKNNVAIYMYYPQTQKGYAVLINNYLTRF